MKIAFIKRNFSYHGGAERYLATLISALKKEDHEIHIFTNSWTDDSNIIFHKVKVLPYGSFLKAYTFNNNLKINLRDFDIVISFERTTCQHIYRAGEGCHIRWLELRSQLEPFLKKFSFQINPLHQYYLKLEREIFEKTPLIIANSKMVKNEIVEYYKISPNKIIVIYNGVDLNKFSPENRKLNNELREKLKIAKDTKIILFVGSGFRRKGLDLLILSLLKIKDDVVLLVIGKGDTKAYLKKCEDLRIKRRVLFLGTQREIEKFYAISDVFVLPTLYDPFSNATLEAMASGVGVITTKNNGISEIIENGKEGFVLENLFDVYELAHKIELVLKNSQIMGEFANIKAQSYSIEQQASLFLSVIINKHFKEAS